MPSICIYALLTLVSVLEIFVYKYRDIFGTASLIFANQGAATPIPLA